MKDSGASFRGSYREFVPAADHPQIKGLHNADPYEYSQEILSTPLAEQLLLPLKNNLEVPFYGVTSDGVKREGLYHLEDEGAPTEEAVFCAQQMLQSLTSEQLLKANVDLDSEDWRKWCNQPVMLFDVGLRLEHLQQKQIDLIMQLLKISLGEAGFAKAESAIKTNKFLGEICNSRPVLNEHSYFFYISGQPSLIEPWGFNFFGHHLCLSIFFVGRQMTVSPAFVGAEPNIIDTGPDRGIELFTEEAKYGLQLMQSLDPDLQHQAQIYAKMHDPRMSKERWNLMDQQHMAGTGQDNRVIPYEGVTAGSLDSSQRAILLQAIRAFLSLLPPSVLEHRIQHIEQHLNETYFSWIGGFSDDDPFYYRIQSPVVLLEFDHHSGVFLTNEHPAKYHIHTIIRTPNGNDYSRELIRLWRLKKEHDSETR